MSIAVIAGLGNPGLKYRNTRHNLGFECIDHLAKQLSAQWKNDPKFEAEIAQVSVNDRKLLLVKPQTFMNSSGRSLGAILRYRRLTPESLLVLYDDLTLEFGRVKLSHCGSAGGHNGITSILEQVGVGFNRYRIGIGAKPHKEMDLADYVLSQLTQAEQKILADSIPSYLEHIQLIIDSGIEPAMNLINQRTAPQHERNDSQ